MKKSLGFTLAEVLITLIIIGVIAAMTIPTLLSNTKGKELEVGLKKAVSSINQAITLNYALDGRTVENYVTATNTPGTNEDLIADLFGQRMSLMRAGSSTWTTTDGATFSLCGPTETPVTAPNTPQTCTLATAPAAGCTDVAGGTPCYRLLIDVNGPDKGPNRATIRPGNSTQASAGAPLVGPELEPKDQYLLDMFTQSVVPITETAAEMILSGQTRILGTGP